VIGARRRQRDVVVGGFSQAVLAEVRRQDGSLATSASGAEVRRALRRAWFGFGPGRVAYRLFQLPIRYRGRRVLSERFARTVLRSGLPVHAWVTDEADEMRMLRRWGVTGLITDRPDIARTVLYPTR
jgi:glycerophosphoryl diester phosphodiesterase